MPRPYPLLFAAAAVGITSVAGFSADPGRILPKTASWNQPNGTLAAALAGFPLPVETPADAGTTPCPAAFDNAPAWDALQRIAARTGTGIVLRDHGRKIALAKRTGPPQPASVDGPFRVAVRQVRSVADLDTGRSFTELALDIHWEPRVMVFRLDAQPTITTATDDRGTAITSSAARAKTPPTWALFPTTVRLEGVPRAATKLTRVAGTFTVTAADRMLGFAVPLGAKLPATQTNDGVTVAVTRAGRIGDRYEVAVDLTYPDGHPEFESFESFVTDNRAELTANGKTWPATDPEVLSNGRRVSAVYRFPAAVPAGAEFRYATPAPLSEYPVRFELTDVPLP